MEFGAVGGGEPEGFHLGEVELGEEGVVEVGDRTGRRLHLRSSEIGLASPQCSHTPDASGEIDRHNFGRLIDLHLLKQSIEFGARINRSRLGWSSDNMQIAELASEVAASPISPLVTSAE